MSDELTPDELLLICDQYERAKCIGVVYSLAENFPGLMALISAAIRAVEKRAYLAGWEAAREACIAECKAQAWKNVSSGESYTPSTCAASIAALTPEQDS